MTKYFFLISLILSVACKEGFQNSDDNRPNIIFMMSDDHTVKHGEYMVEF